MSEHYGELSPETPIVDVGAKQLDLEANDQVLNQLDQLKEDTKLVSFKKKLREHKIVLIAGAVLLGGAALNADKVEDIWRWIKLQAAETIASGPTLSSDPIGVFSRSFIGYSESMGGIDQNLLIPLNFTSITRFKEDAVRFKSEFKVQESARLLAGCDLVVEGILDGADGGVSDGNYLAVVTCKGRRSKMLEGFKLVAFPPLVNTLLAPPNYYLLDNRDGVPADAK